MKNLLLILAALVPAHGEELTVEALKAALASKVEAFEEVELAGDGKPVKFDIQLGEKPVEVLDEVYDGFRFRCPKLPDGADFVWYFNAPQGWGSWYILPVEGDPKPAFKNWLDGDKLYEPFDKGGENNRLRVLQTLDGDYFTAGKEYLVWFRKTENTADNALRGCATFAKSDDDWDWGHDAVEKALGLKVAAPEVQVAALSSRGGMILLDKEFFDPPYAAGRIDSAFFSIRNTKRMSGGFFLAMQTAVPPCKTTPSLAAIVKKHGAADFVRTGEEMAKLLKHAGRAAPDDDEKGITRHSYDYFSFEVESGAKDPKVLRVVTHGGNFAALRPPPVGASFGSIEIENLTVFHKDGKEVGRAYYFREGEKEPLFIHVPPAGEYRSGDDRLTAKGDGEWLWESRFANGQVARRMPMKANRLHGKAEGFHENGQPRFTAQYRKGKLEGELVQFNEAGKETSRRKFKDGEPAEDE